ncbi:MAG: beta-N-acetylhexosaminidase [Bacillota bacterium]
MNGCLKKAWKALVVLAAFICIFTCCGYAGGDDGSEKTTHAENSNTAVKETPGDPGKKENGRNNAHWLDPRQTGGDADLTGAAINNMSLEEKIGQMFIIGFDGSEPDVKLKEMICEKHVGGVVLFRRNVVSPEQLLGLLNSIKTINAGCTGNNAGNGRISARAPLFISVDEEGGSVSRMPGELAELPTAFSIGETGDINCAYEMGSLIAEMIKAFGFNMNFAPVLDIWSNPRNTVIGDRSYGQDPDIVARLGVQAMKGISGEGVIPVVKHFPGHGDTVADSHKELPKVNHSLDRLMNFELVPFKEAIVNNADVVMVGHILLTEIDPEYPATLSEAVITGLLRGKMQFDGLVITDDMTMGAIEENYNIGDAAVRSIIAGCDIILVCHGYREQKEAVEAVKAAVAAGSITEARINESVQRILELKKKYGLTDNPVDTVDVDGINKKIEALKVKWYNR